MHWQQENNNSLVVVYNCNNNCSLHVAPSRGLAAVMPELITTSNHQLVKRRHLLCSILYLDSHDMNFGANASIKWMDVIFLMENMVKMMELNLMMMMMKGDRKAEDCLCLSLSLSLSLSNWLCKTKSIQIFLTCSAAFFLGIFISTSPLSLYPDGSLIV